MVDHTKEENKMTDWRRPVVIAILMLVTLAVMYIVVGFTELPNGISGGGAW